MTNESASQTLVLDLIRNAGKWNNFNGELIAGDLEANRSLWRAAYMTMASDKLFPDLSPYGIRHQFNLLPLRQLTEGYLCYDALFVLPQPGAHDDLVQLVSNWNADELSWWSLDFVFRAMKVNKKLNGDLFPDPQRGVLYVWWD